MLANEPMDTERDENENEDDNDNVTEDRYIQFKESKLDEYFKNELEFENKMKKFRFENLNRLFSSSSSYKTPQSHSDGTPLPQFPALGSNESNENIRQIPNDGHYSKFNTAVFVILLKCNETIGNNECCQNEYSTEEELLNHRENMHQIMRYACFSEGCSMSFKESKLLFLHFDNHKIKNLNKTVKCKADNCSKTFTTLNGLNIHYGKFHQEGIFQCIKCTVCSTSFKEIDKHTKKCFVKNLKDNFITPPRELRNSSTN